MVDAAALEAVDESREGSSPLPGTSKSLCDGTGRRRGFKSPRRNACRFKSCQRHQGDSMTVSAKLFTKFDVRGEPITAYYSYPEVKEDTWEKIHTIIGRAEQFHLTVERK